MKQTRPEPELGPVARNEESLKNLHSTGIVRRKSATQVDGTSLALFTQPQGRRDISQAAAWNERQMPFAGSQDERHVSSAGSRWGRQVSFRGERQVSSVELEQAPVIEGVRVPDDPKEANIVYRNARFVGFVLYK